MTKKVPEIRFEGFTDGWEQRKLKDVSEMYDNLRVPVTASDRVVGDTPYYGANGIQDYVAGYTHDGEYVLIAEDGANDLLNYPVNYVNGKVWINNHAHVVSGKVGKLNNLFLVSRIKSMNLVPWLVGGGRAKLNGDVLKKLPILIPDFEEQQKIGAFFKSLDNTIALHQRKLEQLQSIKDGFLQKMFPKDGEKEPEIRFLGFADDLEQRKLGDIYKKIRNAFVGTATPYYVEEGNFYLESNNIKDGNINRKTEVFINDEFYEKQKDKWLKTGDLVMVQSGHVGHTAVIPEELNNTAAHALIMFQEQKRKTNPYFLNYQFLTDRSKRKLDMITTGNTIKHILASEMKNFEVFVCENDEENLIADFFKKLDDTIALHQRELELLKQSKKAFLQKMFV